MVRWATGRWRRRRGRRPSRAATGWKVNSCAGSGFPASPTAIALSLLPFPADGSCRLFEQQWGEREANEVLFRSGEGERVWREQLQALRLQRERARECEESNYKRWGSSVYIYTGESVKSANPRKQAPRLQCIRDEVIIRSLRDRIAPYPSILTSQRILLARIMLKCSYRTRDLKFDERTG